MHPSTLTNPVIRAKRTRAQDRRRASGATFFRILFTVLFGLCLSAIAPMLLAGLLRLGQVQPDFDVAELDRQRMSTPALHPIFIDPLNGSR